MVKKPKSNVETFHASVKNWTGKTDAAMLAVFQQSAQDVIIKMQTPKAKGGRMPVKFGFLRSSLQVTLNTPYRGFIQRTGEGPYRWDETQVSLTINDAVIGDTVYAAYAANYAIHREYGTRYSAGDFFVRSAAQTWPQIVENNVRKLRAR